MKIIKSINRRKFIGSLAKGLALASFPGCSHQLDFRKNLKIPKKIDGHFHGQDNELAKFGHFILNKNKTLYLNDFHPTNEIYDLVVVGSGISGLASAYHFYKEKKGNCKILILEGSKDFGGHAKRNTIPFNGKNYIVNSGTHSLEYLNELSSEVRQTFNEIGIDFHKIANYKNSSFEKKFNLSSGVYFDKDVYGLASSDWVSGFHNGSFDKFIEHCPFNEQIKKELITFYSPTQPFLKGISNPKNYLSNISWEDLIRKKMKLGDEVVYFANLYATDMTGLGADAISALNGLRIKPGLSNKKHSKRNNKKLPDEVRFPDGTHTVARMFLKKLIPKTFSGSENLEDVFNSQINYEVFDQEKNNVRVRLNAMVLQVKHLKSENSVGVYYLNKNKKITEIKAKSVILATWGHTTKHVVAELPKVQIQSLNNYLNTSCLYINVLLKNWRPLEKLGLNKIYTPGGFCTWMELSDPISIGPYRPEYHPDRPIILSMYKYLFYPGLSAKEQTLKGRKYLAKTSFLEIENSVKKELSKLFGPFGLDVTKDIEKIIINRWAHGYNFFRAPKGMHKTNSTAFLKGRKQFNQISFAGAETGGYPSTSLAIKHGIRASKEQLS